MSGVIINFPPLFFLIVGFGSGDDYSWVIRCNKRVKHLHT